MINFLFSILIIVMLVACPPRQGWSVEVPVSNDCFQILKHLMRHSDDILHTFLKFPYVKESFSVSDREASVGVRAKFTIDGTRNESLVFVYQNPLSNKLHQKHILYLTKELDRLENYHGIIRVLSGKEISAIIAKSRTYLPFQPSDQFAIVFNHTPEDRAFIQKITGFINDPDSPTFARNGSNSDDEFKLMIANFIASL